MADLISFKIDIADDRYADIIPIYVIGEAAPVDFYRTSRYRSQSTKITFANGVVIEKIDGCFLYRERYVASLDLLFPDLPQQVVDTIIFNLDVFKQL